jgi:hypothetical protein
MPAYALKLNDISKDKSFLACIRMLCERTIKDGYISVKDMLSDLSNHDLNMLIEMASPLNDNNAEGRGQIFMYSMIFATAEGSVLIESENVDGIVNQVCALLLFESFRRRGLVELFPDKFVFDNGFEDVVKPSEEFSSSFRELFLSRKNNLFGRD